MRKKKKGEKKQMLNKIINTLSCIAAIVFFVSIAAIDSESFLPLIGCTASVLWFVFLLFLSERTMDDD